MTVTIRFKVGDTVPLQYAIEEWNIDTQGVEPYDLTGKTVTFSLYSNATSEWVLTDQPCSIVSASEGLVSATGLPEVTGMYRVVFKATDGSNVASFPEYGTQWLWIMDDSEV